jgi:hypothetical protein
MSTLHDSHVFLKAIKLLLTILKPLLKKTMIFEKGYILAFK